MAVSAPRLSGSLCCAQPALHLLSQQRCSGCFRVPRCKHSQKACLLCAAGPKGRTSGHKGRVLFGGSAGKASKDSHDNNILMITNAGLHGVSGGFNVQSGNAIMNADIKQVNYHTQSGDVDIDIDFNKHSEWNDVSAAATLPQ